MVNITNIIIAGLYTIISIIKSPLYWIVVLLVYFQYRRIGKMEKRIIGVNKESTIFRVLKASIIGVAGGLMGSIVIMVLGITIAPNDFWYIIGLAVLLMLIHPRFLCFSYAGGIISILNLAVGFPRINVPSIMAIVAILHLIESFLILVDGDSTKVPILIKRDNNIVGGFNMLKFWPIPFIILIAQARGYINGGMTTTDWWPIFRVEEYASFGDSVVLLMAGVIAALGYGDMAITEHPKKKTRSTAKSLFIYSCTLLLLSVLASYNHGFKLMAALFAPIAHEMIIQLGRRKESKGTPVYTAPNRGIKILDIIPGTPADRMGLKTGDIILSLNGFYMNSNEDIKQLLFYRPTCLIVEYINNKGRIAKREFNTRNSNIDGLGVLTVPKDSSYNIVTKEVRSPLLALLERIRNKVSKDKGLS